MVGRSSGSLDVMAHKVGAGPVSLLLIGGVHGDEPEGFYLVERFLAEKFWAPLSEVATLVVIPRLNPEGCAKDERTNSNGVDLNRNMPTKDWDPVAHKPRYNPGPQPGSELETQLLLKVIGDIQPRAIFSAHSWEPMINYNGPCRALAELMAQRNKYRVADDIGYPTPGSLGTWAGWERKIPTITLEIERHLPLESVWSVHAHALLAGLLYAATNENLESV